MKLKFGKLFRTASRAPRQEGQGGVGRLPATGFGKLLLAAGFFVGAGMFAAAATPQSREASALTGITCDSPNILSTVNNDPTLANGVYSTNKDTGVSTPLLTSTTTPVALPATMYQLNQIGLSSNAKTMVFTATYDSKTWLVSYDVAGDKYFLTQTLGGVAGGFNIQNDYFYYGKVTGGHAILHIFNPETKLTQEYALDITLPEASGVGNGDLAFDASGNMWIVASGDADFVVYRVDGPIPTSGSMTDPSNQRTATVMTKQLGQGGGVNGIAFGSDGLIYTSKNGALRSYNPTTADLVKTSFLNAVTDLGTCADPPRIRSDKNLPAGRYLPTDQFKLTITPGGSGGGNTATTTGTAVGIQKEVAGPVLGLNVNIPGSVEPTVFTIVETPAGTTSLANYVTTWACVNEVVDPTAVIASGTGPSLTLTMPPELGSNVKCTFTNIPKGILRVQKNLPLPRAVPTDQFTLSLAPGGSPSVTTTGTATGQQAETVILNEALPGTSYTITEAASGTTDLAFYDSKWACVDTANGNLPVATGAGITGTFTMPTTGGPNRADILCTFTNTAKKGDLVVSKSVDPVDGSTVVTDQTVTYTLAFENKGSAPAKVDYVDDMAGVLDDADITSPPAAAAGSGLTATAVVGGKFSITGYVAPGATALVTTKVKVKADDKRGDNVLLNFVFPTGTTPPSECVVGDPLCTRNPVPELVPSKSASPPDGSTVQTGQQVTYTLKFDNTAGKAPATVNWEDNIVGVLDDATMTSSPTPSVSTLVVSPVAAGKFTVTGTVGAGQVGTVMYTVTVKPDADRGDNLLLNFLLPPGTPPPSTCVTGNPMCTAHPVPELVIRKSSVPASGTTVTAGQVVAYTLTFDNTRGKAAAPVAWDDNVSGVLDDAVVTAQPASSSPALTASSISNGVFKIRGTLPAGKSATVTYKVQVKPDGQRGDDILLNFVVKPNTLPPATCVTGDPLCTKHPVPELVVTKDVDPVDGSTVMTDQTLVYTVTFDNTRGKAPATVKWTDDLSGVLDDATLTKDPATTYPSLKVSPVTTGRFSVDGTVAAGQKATVTLSVKVNAPTGRLDNVLLNYVFKTGTNPPDECADRDPLCTRNPVDEFPSISLKKSVLGVADTNNDKSQNTVGDTVTYGFVVTNTGNVTLTDIVLNDPKLSSKPLTCPRTTLKPGESMSCTGPTYVLTQADLAATKVTNVATTSGQPPHGPRVSATDKQVVPVYPPAVVPETGSSLQRSIAGVALPLMLVGAALTLIRRRERVGLTRS